MSIENAEVIQLAEVNTDALKEAAKAHLAGLCSTLSNYVLAQHLKLMCAYLVEHPDRGPLIVSHDEDLTVCGDETEEFTPEERHLNDDLGYLGPGDFMTFKITVTEDGVDVTNVKVDPDYVENVLHVLDD